MSDTESVKEAPAPWTLNGQCSYLFLHGTRPVFEEFNENSDSLRTPHAGGRGGVLVVRYTDSPVGPYDELILFPGCYKYGDQTYYRITQIYVSSIESVVNGRRNWAVPKKLAIFDWSEHNNIITVKIRLPNSTEPFCTLRIRPRLYCLPLPVSSALIPISFRTIVQPALDEHGEPMRYFKISPTCTGWFRPIVQLIDFVTDGKEIPSHDALPVYRFGVGYEQFTLIFPEAEILPLISKE